MTIGRDDEPSVKAFQVLWPKMKDTLYAGIAGQI